MARFGLKNDIFEGTIQYRYKMGSESQFIYCYQLISTPGHPNGSEKHGVGELWGGGADKPHLACSILYLTNTIRYNPFKVLPKILIQIAQVLAL